MFYNMKLENFNKPIYEGLDEDTFREYRLRKIHCFEGEYNRNMPKEIIL